MSTAHPAQSPGRRYLVTAVKLLVSALLLWVLFRRVDMSALWAQARQASVAWLLAALALYGLNVLIGTWRWQQLLDTQHVHVKGRWLLGSFLVATFFNNFLPSNIGGDVIRIGDTAKRARSKTLATIVVFFDRAIGLMALVLVAVVGMTMAGASAGHAPLPISPMWLWVGLAACALVTAPAVLAPSGVAFLLRPLTLLHPEWVGGRIDTLTAVLTRFRARPFVLLGCFVGAMAVQSLTVGNYLAVVYALRIPISAWDLAVIVPLSFVVQMAPVSVNGFGVREATFSFYFRYLGLPIESAVLMSLVATALTMLFSLSGAAVYVARRH